MSLETPTPSRLSERWRHILEVLVSDPHLHGRWLNTLSLLEHIGSRKIIKALDSHALDETLLRHIAEETRHAHFFKTLCLRVSPSCETYSPESLFLGDRAKHYFQSLDHEVAAYLQQERIWPDEDSRGLINYLCVTHLIEIRATQIYRVYQEVLQGCDFTISLKSVLVEEQRHLREMSEAFHRVGFDLSGHEKALAAIESPLFASWTAAMQDAVAIKAQALGIHGFS